jgi:hypothetical protein
VRKTKSVWTILLSILLQLDAIDIGEKKNSCSFSRLFVAKVKPPGLRHI